VEAMVNGLETGIIDIIATDHAPHTQVDKQCTYDQAAFGISNFETALGSVLALVENGQVNLSTIINSMTYAPAQILNSKLGTLSKGASADVTIFDPKAEWVVDSDNFTSKGKNTPLAGTTLKGKVLATLVNGTFAYRDKKKLPTIDAH
jgi:dihydroorotase